MKLKINKRFVIFLVIAILLVALILGVLVYFLSKPDYEKYQGYEEKIKTYGFDTMYDNNTCTTKENVTKSEALKMVISTMLNITDISKMSIRTDETYSNADYVEYAKLMGIISDEDINKDTADDVAKYSEVLRYVENSKKILLKQDPKSDVEVIIKNYNNLNSEMQIVVSDLVSNQILPNEKSNIKINQKVFKGLLNELLINIAEKLNTITVADAKLNINKDKVPTNEDQYPYILSNVDKKIYEYDFFNVYEEDFKNPKETYLIKREFYQAIYSRIESFYNLILNVDYQTINYDEFYNELSTYTSSKPNADEIKSYVEYVKKNQIKLTGSGKACLPAVYFDGERYRVRTKLTINISSPNTRNNLFVFDAYSGENYEYGKDSYEITVDTEMLTGFDFESLYIYPGEFVSSILDNDGTIK